MIETNPGALESKVRSKLNVCSVLFIPALVFAVAGYFGVFKPEEESISVWFQRSGSLIVMLAVIVEFNLLSIHTYLNSARIHFNEYAALKKKYGVKHNMLSVLTVIIAIAGTIIWGYGDLFR